MTEPATFREALDSGIRFTDMPSYPRYEVLDVELLRMSRLRCRLSFRMRREWRARWQVVSSEFWQAVKDKRDEYFLQVEKWARAYDRESVDFSEAELDELYDDSFFEALENA